MDDLTQRVIFLIVSIIIGGSLIMMTAITAREYEDQNKIIVFTTDQFKIEENGDIFVTDENFTLYKIDTKSFFKLRYFGPGTYNVTYSKPQTLFISTHDYDISNMERVE